MVFGFKTRATVVAFVAIGFASACSARTIDTKGLSPQATQGAKFAAQNCLACHSVNGADGQGPTWKGLAGSQVKLTDGTTVTADDNYLAAAIDDPDAQIVSGYHKGIMSSAFPKGAVNPTQVQELVAYIDALK